MDNINDLLFNNYFDCHYHGFGRYGTNLTSVSSLYMVDNPIKYKNSLVKYFTKNENILNHNLFLVIGKDIEETKLLLNKYKNSFGIGELKVYKQYISINNKNTIKKYSNLQFLKDVLNLNIKKPIFIHYDIDNQSIIDLEKILGDYKDRTVVLCHCGMNELFDKEQTFELVRNLQQKYANLFLDISWVALDYFLENKQKFANLDNTRLLLGSDNNGLNDNYQEKMKELSQYVNNKVNLEILKELSK